MYLLKKGLRGIKQCESHCLTSCCLWPPPCVIMVLSVWSSPPTVCPPVRRHATAPPSHFPDAAGRRASDSLPAGRWRCQQAHQHTVAHTYLYVQATAHTLTHINQMLGPPLHCPSMHPGYLAAVPLRTAATTRLDWRFHCMVAHTHMHTHKESHKRATNSTGFIHPQLWCKLISGDGRLNQKVITFYGKIINKNCHNKQT